MNQLIEDLIGKAVAYGCIIDLPGSEEEKEYSRARVREVAEALEAAFRVHSPVQSADDRPIPIHAPPMCDDCANTEMNVVGVNGGNYETQGLAHAHLRIRYQCPSCLKVSVYRIGARMQL